MKRFPARRILFHPLRRSAPMPAPAGRTGRSGPGPWWIGLAGAAGLVAGGGAGAQTAPSAAAAQAAPATADVRLAQSAAAAGLSAVTVSGARVERRIDEVPASISIIDAEDIETQRVRDVRDLDRYEPNLSVRRGPTRFGLAQGTTGRAGNEGFNIRGLEGNRVLMQVDGIRLPNSFSFGANSFGRADYLDVSTIERVEILRGPASTLYGSDGLAGVVSFVTRDPDSLLRRSGRDVYASASMAYDSADRSFAETLGAATRLGRWDVMGFYTRRDGKALRNQGTNDAANVDRTRPNPQDYGSNALLAKAVYHHSATNTFRITLDAFSRHVDTDVLSGIARPPLAATSVVGLTAQDRQRRVGLVLDHRIDALDAPLADSLRWFLYRQDTKARQNAYEDRNTAADRSRSTRYDETWTGGGVVVQKTLAGAATHKLVYGADASTATYEGIRDGTVPPVGETFPAKSFPDTRYNLFGAYLQDEIVLAGGDVSVIPGLRWDAYRLSPSTDGYVGDASKSDGSRFSPRIGLIWRLPVQHSVFANFSEGFRAPTPDQVNNGFSNPVTNYRSEANPNLRPETSRSIEIGLRRSAPGVFYSVSAFAGRYKNFIDQQQVSGSFTTADPAVFQFINAGEVRLHGIEATGSYRVAPAWRLIGGLGWVHGTNTSAGRPLNSVDPFKAIAGVNWEPAEGTMLGLRATAVAAKKSSRIDSSSLVTAPATQFATPGYATFDLFGSWRLNRHLQLFAGVFNLTDRKYWRWTDVRGLSSSSTVVDAYTQPGRTASVMLKIEL
ncbi:MAG: TonB-dependent hemoglobin/transferrin/lactoferrin family receptor [Burkholderiaceae bacterium]